MTTTTTPARHWTGGDWPDDAGWATLGERDRLDALEPERPVTVGADGKAEVSFELPMPSMSLVELLPGVPG